MNNLKKLVASALVAIVIIPTLVFAENEGNENNRDNKTSINFCARISSVEQKFADQVTRTETKQSTYQSNRMDKITKRESDVDAKRAFGRGNKDDTRVKNWDKMIGRAKTDAEKIAIEAYKSAIANAVTIRRTAVDTAVASYRNGLNAVLANHNSALDQAIATFKATVDSALAKAKADCTAGIASQTVKEAFNKAVAEARKTLQGARKSAETNSGVTALKKTRNDAVDLAILNFKTATEKARADLMLVLKK